MFAVKDKALDTYSSPFIQATVEAGLRMFRDAVLFNSEQNHYQRSPEDYTLYMIGTYDDEKAEVVSTENTAMQSAVEIMAERRPENVAQVQ